jgi:crotonobetainyl-CoA:carnitine CoA-transferase CaiB-like acyl-CoA transferase
MTAAQYLCEGQPLRRGELALTGGLVCYYPYEAKDGWVSCGALEPKFWQAFCRGVGREDLIEAQFERPGSEAWSQIAEVFRSRSREEWRAFDDEHDCCIEPVLELEEALESDLVRERAMVAVLDQPQIGPVRQLGIPIKMSRTPGSIHAPAPALGEHTHEALAEAGYSDEEIEALLASGAAAGPATEAQGAFLS